MTQSRQPLSVHMPGPTKNELNLRGNEGRSTGKSREKLGHEVHESHRNKVKHKLRSIDHELVPLISEDNKYQDKIGTIEHSTI